MRHYSLRCWMNTPTSKTPAGHKGTELRKIYIDVGTRGKVVTQLDPEENILLAKEIFEKDYVANLTRPTKS